MGKRPNANARGYNAAHQRERKRWAVLIASDWIECHAPMCLMPSRVILPGMAWDLGHTPDRMAWTGPEHATCNRSEGARRGNRSRNHAFSFWKL